MFFGTLVGGYTIIKLAFKFAVITFNFACRIITSNMQGYQADAGTTVL